MQTLVKGKPAKAVADGETAVFGGGCFWCLDAVYRELQGVSGVRSGYAGGFLPDPTYEDVCSGTTGHAEVVEVRFDPKVITYGQLVEVFFTIHDPTSKDRQGADVGPQYRSIILTTNPSQEATAMGVRDGMADAFPKPVLTEIRPLLAFYPAEAHHQDYYRRNPEQGYCKSVISPKLAKFRSKWQILRKGTA